MFVCSIKIYRDISSTTHHVVQYAASTRRIKSDVISSESQVVVMETTGGRGAGLVERARPSRPGIPQHKAR